MKILFDTTVKQFDDKIVYERTQIEDRYAKILRDQRLVMQTFEKKYTLQIMNKIEKLENIVNDVAYDQLKNPNDRDYTDNGLFPKNVTSSGNAEKRINDTYRDQQIANLKQMVTQLKSEHGETSTKLREILGENNSPNGSGYKENFVDSNGNIV